VLHLGALGTRGARRACAPGDDLVANALDVARGAAGVGGAAHSGLLKGFANDVRSKTRAHLSISFFWPYLALS
jgi:hypothetical protein